MAQNICAAPSKIKVPPHVKQPTQIPLNRRGVVLLEMIPKPFSFAEIMYVLPHPCLLFFS